MYLLFGSLGIGLGILYKNEISNYILSSLWNATRYYHKTNIYLEENGYISKKKLEEKKKKSENYIIQYNSKTDKIKVNDINTFKLLKDTDLLIIQKNHLYKRIQNYKEILKENENFINIKKPFLQVDFIQDNKSIEINDNLKSFYLNGNIILDNIFMKWFMKYFYNKNIEKYTISIIDENVNMFEIKENEKIQITDSGYKII
tara:strand:+ start:92 stop:697 length:606 start_codon:yes stop_codon:yes gene_type:complete